MCSKEKPLSVSASRRARSVRRQPSHRTCRACAVLSVLPPRQIPLPLRLPLTGKQLSSEYFIVFSQVLFSSVTVLGTQRAPRLRTRMTLPSWGVGPPGWGRSSCVQTRAPWFQEPAQPRGVVVRKPRPACCQILESTGYIPPCRGKAASKLGITEVLSYYDELLHLTLG